MRTESASLQPSCEEPQPDEPLRLLLNREGFFVERGMCRVEELPTLTEITRKYFDFVLALTQGNKQRSARVLGVDRRTVYRRLGSK